MTRQIINVCSSKWKKSEQNRTKGKGIGPNAIEWTTNPANANWSIHEHRETPHNNGDEIFQQIKMQL